MIGLIIPWLLRIGVPQRFARAGSYALLALVAVGLFFAAKALYDRSVIDAHDDKREAASAGNRETSANERAADAVALDASEKERTDAIKAAPTGGTVSPAARALACERLRRVGRTPAACGPAGGDGT